LSREPIENLGKRHRHNFAAQAGIAIPLAQCRICQ
jgi:hypothetical protein